MDFTMWTADLASELAVVEKVVSKRPTIPALACAQMTVAEDGSLTLVGTDAHVGIVSRHARATKVVKPGAMLVPVGRLTDLVQSFPGDVPVRLWQDGLAVRIAVSAAGYVGVLQALDVADFPAVPEPVAGSVFRSIPAGVLLGLVRHARHAVGSNDSPHGTMTGALVECDAEAVRVVATDSHRLAVAEAAISGGAKCSTILSQMMIQALVEAFDGFDGIADLYVAGSHIFISGGTRSVFGQVLEGTFPAWRRIIPSYEKTVAVPRQAMVGALRRARMIVGASHVILRFGFEREVLKVSVVAASVGAGDESIAVAYDGPPVAIGLKASYLLDFLEAVGSDNVGVQFGNGEQPFVLKSSEGDMECVGVVMPVAIR